MEANVETESRKRKLGATQTIVNALTIENCAAKLLAEQSDQEYACDFINFVYSLLAIRIAHSLNKKDNYYIVQFDQLSRVDIRQLEQIVKKFDLLRNVDVIPVVAAKNPNNKSYFILSVEIFYVSLSANAGSVPVFEPLDIHPDPLTQDMFAQVVGNNKNIWKEEWNQPFEMLRSTSYALCNITEFPPDVEIHMLYGEPSPQRYTYGLKVLKFGVIPYSFFEYIEVNLAMGFAFHFHYEHDATLNINALIIKFVEHRPEDGPNTVVLKGEAYYTNLPKRSLTGKLSVNTTKKARTQEAAHKKSWFSWLFD